TIDTRGQGDNHALRRLDVHLGSRPRRGRRSRPFPAPRPDLRRRRGPPRRLAATDAPLADRAGARGGRPRRMGAAIGRPRLGGSPLRGGFLALGTPPLRGGFSSIYVRDFAAYTNHSIVS